MIYVRYYLLFFFLGMVFSLASQDQSATTDTITVTEQAVREIMPRFRANCPTGPEGKACADQAMLQYVYSRIRYPRKARRNGVEGMAVVTFVIEVDGTVTNVQVLRDPGAGIGQEVQRIVESMNDYGPSWEAGIQDGKLVRVQFNLPVQFSLSEKGK
ncbi:energy transducer TonB [Lewinella sp. IMCC34191]|uniref:energy transducer TonB n=1 Tax=Lewinella sp. IMCC34191 TaxID=2259172 RepID=UPI0013005D9C|nr:energy transducer TonB [Lewinella sp. IMCC34191]